MTDSCHFCHAPDACYQKRDKAGVWQDVCWNCVKPTKPQKKAVELDPTILDDLPPTPVDSTLQTKPKSQQSLFCEDPDEVDKQMAEFDTEFYAPGRGGNE